MRRYQFKQWLYWHIWKPFLVAVLFFYPRYCDWHKGDSPTSYDPEGYGGIASCPECGCLLDTKRCDRCGKEFLDWANEGYGDDVMCPPAATSSGDLMCRRCAAHYEEQEERDSEDWPDYDSCEPAD